MAECPDGKFGCQACGPGVTTQGTGVCHVCEGRGHEGDPSTPCSRCGGSKTCQNCNGTGCL